MISDESISSEVSTEAIMRGTISEALVIKFVERLPLVEVIDEFGMFTCNENVHLGCFSNVVALFNIDDEVLTGGDDIQWRTVVFELFL